MAFNVGTAMAYLDLDITAFNSALQGAQQGLSNFAGEAGGKFDTVMDKIQNLGGAFTNLGNQLTQGITVPIVSFGSSALDAYRDAESAFTGVKKTLDVSGLSAEEAKEAYAKLDEEIKKMATSTASSYEEIAGVMEIAGQLGVPLDKVAEFSKVMTMLGDSTNLSADQASEALAKMMNITGTSFDEVSNLGSAIVDLGNHFATQEDQIVLMSTRLASAGTMAGLSTQEILALGTAMSSVGIRAEAGGTAMSTTLSQITKMIANLNSTNEETAKEAANQLQTIARVSGMTSEQFVTAWRTKPIDALTAFITGLNNAQGGTEETVLVLEQLGMEGIRQSNMLRSLALASDKLSGSVEMSNEAWERNTALSEEAELRYGTMDSKISQLNERFKDVKRQIAEILIPWIEKLMGVLEQLIDWWNGLSDSVKENIVKWAGVVAAIGPVLMIFGKILSVGGTIGKLFGTLGGIVEKLIGAKGFGGLSSILGGFNPIVMLVVGAIGLAVYGFIRLWNESETFRKAVVNLAQQLKRIWEKAKPIIDLLADILANTLFIAFQVFVDWVENCIDALGDFLDSIFGLIDAVKEGDWSLIGKYIIEGIINGIKFCFESMFGIFKVIFDWIWNGICKVFGIHSPATEMMPIGENILLGIVEGFKAMFGEFIKAAGEFASLALEWLGNIVDSMGQRLKQFVEWVGGIWNGIVDLWNDSWSAIGDFFSRIYDEIGNFFSSVWDTISNFFSDVIGKIGDFISGSYNNIVTFLGDIVKSVVDFISNIIGNVADFLSNLWKNIVDFVANVVKNIVDFFADIVKKTIDFFASAFGEVGKGIGNILKAIVDFFAEVIKGAVDFFADLFKNLIGFIGDVVKNIAKFIGDIIKAIVDFFVELYNKWDEGFIEILKVVGNFIGDVVKALADFFKNMIKSAIDFFLELIGNIRSFGSRLFDAGKEIFNSLFSGFMDVWNKIIAWVDEKFGWIVEKAKWVADQISKVIPGFSEGNMFGLGGSHRSGLDYVPYDGYIAKLHQGERVLTKQEARDYNDNVGGNGGDVYNFYNTKPDPYEYSRQMKRVKRELKTT